MITGLRRKFSAKLILLIGLAFLIPVITALVTIKVTSNHSIAQFDSVLAQPDQQKRGLIKELFPGLSAEEVADPGRAVRLIREYEHRRTFGLFMSLIVISVALAAVVILLSMLILKRGMVSLHELSLAARRVGQGDFALELEPRSQDEFAGLVRAFRTMATRLKETMVSRDFYNHAIESMPAAVFTVDADGVVTTWNRQAEELTGLPARETLGRELASFEAVLGPPARREEIPFFGREGVIRGGGGRQRIVSRGVDFLYDWKGAHAGVIETFVDISEQKELERELISARERAEESSRLRSEFLANMSHEIRTPLNGILGLAEMLSDDEGDPERRENLATIRQCGQNLLHLINEILELSKLEAGRMILHPVLAVTADIVREAAGTIEPGCHKKGLAFSVEIDGETPLTVEIDRRKLVQILINLLGNAFKFTEKGRISLRVAPYRGERRGHLLFQVTDTGIGILPDRQQHIFESFVQAEGYLSRPSEGTGLGLTIARKLVALLGGEMWLESVPGEGSAFSFTIELGPGIDGDRR